MSNIELIPGSLTPTSGDVANGYYPQLTKVDLNSPEFLSVVEWLVSKGAPVPKASVIAAINPGGAGHLMPTNLVFSNAAGSSLESDAALVFNFPHVTLVELKNAFGFGDSKVLEFYPGRQATNVPAPVVASPIGVAWPEQGPNAFRPSADDHFPIGATYSDASGTYFKDFYQWVFVTCPVWRKK